MRKAAALFPIIGSVFISPETIGRCVPSPRWCDGINQYPVYDEQYAHIDGREKYSALLKDSKSGNFVEERFDN